jgi:hypothetical protein
MAGAHKGHLGIGIILAISFWVVLFLIFSPIFGQGRNGLQYADEMFNTLAKGSSYFIPKVAKSNEKFMGKMVAISITLDKPETVENTAKLFTTAGAQVEVQGTELKIAGDLGKTMAAVLNDADAMYHNDGARVSSLYGYNEKEVLKNWHAALTKLDKAFKKEKMVEEAKIVSDVMKKTVETAYNFYQVDAVQVKDKAGLMIGLLVFYVAYTMWWGFAIFFIFEGIGLTMTKAKDRKEV